MTFVRKLATYMLGVGLGCVMVYFIFGDRDLQCNYFPNDRVLYDLRKKELEYSPEVQSKLKAGSVKDSVIFWALERGEVDFERTQKGLEDCKQYFILLEEPAYELSVENCDSTAKIMSVKPI
jgi:hypothetical protein